MSSPTFSPDGKWMWNGSEWIPAPPTGAPSTVIHAPMPSTMHAPMSAPTGQLSTAKSIRKIKLKKPGKIIIGVMIASIILLSSIVFFLANDDKAEIQRISVGPWMMDTGEALLFGIPQSPYTDSGDIMYLQTYESECDESQANQKWTLVPPLSSGFSDCAWRHTEYPNFQKFSYSSDPLGPRICFGEYYPNLPGGCLTFIGVGWTGTYGSGPENYIILDDNGNCDIIVSTWIIDRPQPGNDADWYEENEYLFNNVKTEPEYSQKCTGTESPIDLLIEQIV